MKNDGRYPRVALLVESSRSFGQGLLHGIAEYIRAHGPWSTFLDDRSAGDELPQWLHHWRGDGMIVRVENPSIGKAIQKMDIPIIGLRSIIATPNVPLIQIDDAQVARLGADHFFERGFRTFAYCGFPGTDFSDYRSQHFTDIIRSTGFRCDLYQPPEIPQIINTQELERFYLRYQEHLGRWLKGLPKPVAIMTCNDIRGQQLLSVCKEERIRVPDEVAVMGVDNDEVVCDFSDPPLSSVIPNTPPIGYQAAQLLDKLMHGGKKPKNPILVPPIGIVTRRSTDVLAVEDAELAKALKFIRENAEKGISVSDVLENVSMSRRLLERRFRSVLGRSPKEEILNVRIERIQELLALTDLPISKIAAMNHFEHVEYMNVLFKRKTGKTPGEFRTMTRPRSIVVGVGGS